MAQSFVRDFGMKRLWNLIETLHFENGEEPEIKVCDEAKENLFNCILCLDLPREPNQFACCGKPVCVKCLNDYKSSRRDMVCPHCRTTNIPPFLKLDKVLERQILDLSAQCVFKCGWNGILKGHYDHLETQCLFAKIKCSKCSTVTQLKDYKTHVEHTCLYKCCTFCMTDLTDYELITHNCTKRIVNCPLGCGQNMQRWFVDVHVSSDCPKEKKRCPLNVICKQKPEKRFLEEHFKMCAMEHSSSVMKSIKQIRRHPYQIKVIYDKLDDLNPEVFSQPLIIFQLLNVGLLLTRSTTNGYLDVIINVIECSDTSLLAHIAQKHTISITLFNSKTNYNHMKKEMVTVEHPLLCRSSDKRCFPWLICKNFISESNLSLNEVTNTCFINFNRQSNLTFCLKFETYY